MNKQLLTTIENINVYVNPGKISFEPELFIEHEGKLHSFTIDSGIYENKDNDFFLNESFIGDLQEKVLIVAEKIFCKKESIGEFTLYTLNEELTRKLLEMIEKEIEEERYFNI